MHASKRDFRFCFLVWPSIFHVCMDYVKGGHLSLRVYGIGWMEGFSLKRKMVNHVFPCPCHWICFCLQKKMLPFFSCCPKPRPRSHSPHNHPPPLPFLPPLLSFGFTPSRLSPSQFCAIFWLPYSPLYTILYSFNPILSAIKAHPQRHLWWVAHQLHFTPSMTIHCNIYAKTPSFIATNALQFYVICAIMDALNSLPHRHLHPWSSSTPVFIPHHLRHLQVLVNADSLDYALLLSRSLVSAPSVITVHAISVDSRLQDIFTPFSIFFSPTKWKICLIVLLVCCEKKKTHIKH